MRFYDADRGSISVDGHNIQSVTRNSLRKQYGMVLQESCFSPAQCGKTSRMGREDASLEEVVAAAKKAHAHSFILRLPQGYDTVISEDGGNLSQGQRQLLCIARVMLVDPPMLILDEATSSIDTRTEWKIQTAFEEIDARADQLYRGTPPFYHQGCGFDPGDEPGPYSWSRVPTSRFWPKAAFTPTCTTVSLLSS